jgi:2,3-bisphosphoglycerate-dependent phosphoglycerate mutase|eukprot:7384215-Prymnesium_polylepis.2
MWLPEHKTWRLNERMYGSLTGVSKKATKEQFGDVQFKAWRRGYDTRPPRTTTFSQYYPGNE